MKMEDEIDIKDLFVAIWIKKWVILGVTFIFLILGLIFYGKELNNNSTILKRSVSKDSNEKNNSNLFYVETNFMLSRGKSSQLEFDNNLVQSTYKLNIDSGVITNLNQFATSEQFLKSVLNNFGYGEEIDIDDVKSNITIFGNGNSDVITLIVGFENEDGAIHISENILGELESKINKLYEIEEIITIDGPVVLSKKQIKSIEEKILDSNSILEEVDNSNKNEKQKNLKKKIILIGAVRFYTFLWYYSYN